MYQEFRPVNIRPDGLSEDVTFTITIAANWSGGAVQAQLYMPGSTTPIPNAITATITSASSSGTTVTMTVQGLTFMPPGAWTGSLWRTDTPNVTDSLNFLMEVTQFPSQQGG
jgi:hypothetical protein